MTASRKRAAVAIIGASPKPERYAYRALVLLRECSYRPVPVNPAFSQILGERCYARISDVPEKIDTVTLYLRKERSEPLIQEIISKRPRRIIMNPGAENVELARRAEAEGIEVIQGCTLVMLRTGTF